MFMVVCVQRGVFCDVGLDVYDCVSDDSSDLCGVGLARYNFVVVLVWISVMWDEVFMFVL